MNDREESIFDMESPFTMPIRIYYRPPGSLMLFLSIVHAISILCLLPLALPDWVKCLLALIILYSYHGYTLDYLRARGKRLELILQPDNEWRLVDLSRPDQQRVRVTLIPGAFVHPRLVVLNMQGPAGRFALLLTPQNVDADTFRRLRVRLRYPCA